MTFGKASIVPARNTVKAKSSLAIGSLDIGQEIELFKPGYPKAKSLPSALDGNPPQSDQQSQEPIAKILQKAMKAEPQLDF
jgi:hypothetical protein